MRLPASRPWKIPESFHSFTATKSKAMSTFTEAPFLCNDCQKLGYCRRRAMQAAMDKFTMRRQSTMESPILSDDPEPVPTFREFVAVHRPDLARMLPRHEDAHAGDSAAKKPTLAELRAKIAARKMSPAKNAAKQEDGLSTDQVDRTEQQHGNGDQCIPANSPASTPGSLPFSIARSSCKPTAPLNLVRLGHTPEKHQRTLQRQREHRG
jgi:hypothetical protein